MVFPTKAATLRENSARRAFTASVLTAGGTGPAAAPRSGQTAPKLQAHRVRVSRGARGLLPRLARTRVSLPCRPGRASAMGPGPGMDGSRGARVFRVMLA